MGPIPRHPTRLGIASQGPRHPAHRPAVSGEQDRTGTLGCSVAAQWALSVAPVANAIMTTETGRGARFQPCLHFVQQPIMTAFPFMVPWNSCPPFQGTLQPAGI